MSAPRAHLFVTLSLALLAGGCGLGMPPPADPLDAALKSSLRDLDRARDRYRHPRQTLEFFGLRPDMTVIELWPGGGWYSRILAPTLRRQGVLYAAHFPQADDVELPGFMRDMLADYRRDVDRHRTLSRTRITSLGFGSYDIAPPASADMILSFRSLHNWLRRDELPQVIAAVHRALKPGGVFGVVQHRAPGRRGVKWMKENGYIDENYATRLIVAAGFELVGRSDINANPKDSADHPKGVWSLPPALRGGDVDRDRYLAIGESDRFTLKFVKK